MREPSLRNHQKSNCKIKKTKLKIQVINSLQWLDRFLWKILRPILRLNNKTLKRFTNNVLEFIQNALKACQAFIVRSQDDPKFKSDLN